jgi:class 3 adenylate cyclase/tetratricopeptide (TPR) repeat protein
MPTSAPLPAERRALTVMFCDLVGSTALSARLDPEDLRDLLAAYQRHATAVVEAAGGRVARYEGDGILAYFGYPAASEADAERAVRAGLELAASIRLSKGADAERLSVRVGIATGVVVVGELMQSGVADNPPVVGQTPNLAARLQALAEPGTVLVADTTRHLTGGLFDYRDGGLRPVEGFAEPVRVWRAVGARVTSRFKALRSHALPLLGRDTAMAVLMERWSQARQGSGQVALVSGEPGIGKSRLVQALAERVRHGPATIVRLQCSPHHESSVLHPILERLRRAARADGADALRHAHGDAQGAGLRRLKRLLGRGVAAADEAVALLADLMGLTDAPAAHAQGPRLDAQRKRELLLEGLAGILDRLAQVRPLLLVLEDAHWIDPTSLQLLDLVVGRMNGWPTLLVVTCRPEFKPDWRNRAHVARIEVRPIGADDAERIVRHVAGSEALPETVVRGIVVRSDGVPLFIEELTRAVADAAAPAGSSRARGQSAPAVPTSLQASLMARLDRIGRPRELVRIAAALGRQFTLDELSAVVQDRAPEDLRRELDRLIEADVMVPVASPSSGAYAFRHVLIQDAAYGSLLRSERRALHGRIAAALQDRFPEIAAGQPEIVAAHCTKAELWEPAVRHWLRAGDRAVRGWALAEAAEHYSEGIRIAGNLPLSPERQRLELDLHMALGPVTMGTRGYAAEESLEVYRRAEPLVRAVGDVSEQLMLTMALYNVHYGRAELAEALAAADAYCVLAERHGTNLGRAYGLLAQTHAAMGTLGEADREFQRSLEVFAQTPEDLSVVSVFGSQHVISLAFRAGVLFGLGRAEEGQASAADAVALAYRMEHPLSIALALVTELLTPIPGGLNPDLARADETVRFCARHRLKNFETWAEFARGAIVARRGDPREALKLMWAAVEKAEGMSSRLFRPIHLATMASAHARLREIDKALSLVEQALATAARTGEGRADVALHRLRGELLLAIGRRSEGDHELQLSLSVARSQQAKAEQARTEEAIARLVGRQP